MKRSIYFFLAAVLSVLLAACGGSGGGGEAAAPPTPAPSLHLVTISWQSNHESAVNSLGGGYVVNINGQAPINCPFSGFSLPCVSRNSVQVSLYTGSYTVTVSAYSALNGPGSITGSSSAQSAPMVVQVP